MRLHQETQEKVHGNSVHVDDVLAAATPAQAEWLRQELYEDNGGGDVTKKRVDGQAQ